MGYRKMEGNRQPYHLLPDLPFHHNNTLTPSSAVSSFNLPAACDSSLITPIHPSSPKHHTMTKDLTNMQHSMESKPSPTTISPPDLELNPDDEYAPRYNPPMKWKTSYRIGGSTNDDGFPMNPRCPTPFYGGYCVSATPQSASTTQSATSLQQSPPLMSAVSMSSVSTESRSPSTYQMPALSTNYYRPNNQTPILLAPNPSTFRPSPRHHSLPQLGRSPTSRSPPAAQYSRRSSYSPGTSRPRARRGQSNREDKTALYLWIFHTASLDEDARVLLELKVVNRLSWKNVEAAYMQRLGKNVRIEALQMRLNRLALRYNNAYKYEQARWRCGSSDSGSSDSCNSGYVPAHVDGNTAEILPEKFSKSAFDQRQWSDTKYSNTAHGLPDQESANIYTLLSPHSTIDARSTAPMPFTHRRDGLGGQLQTRTGLDEQQMPDMYYEDNLTRRQGNWNH